MKSKIYVRYMPVECEIYARYSGFGYTSAIRVLTSIPGLYYIISHSCLNLENSGTLRLFFYLFYTPGEGERFDRKKIHFGKSKVKHTPGFDQCLRILFICDKICCRPSIRGRLIIFFHVFWKSLFKPFDLRSCF